MDKEYAKYLLNKTKEDYNLIAEDFSRTREFIWEEIRFLFDNYLISGEKVLDLGCGNGRYFPLFEEKGVEYFGADNSKRLIDIAKKKHPDGKFQEGDALSIPFPDNNFDKVYSIAVLHHIPSRELRMLMLKEVRRILRPGGFLILTVWHFYKLEAKFLLFKHFIQRFLGISKMDYRDILEPWANKTNRYYHYFSKKELASLAKEAGFKIKKIGLVKNKRGNRQNFYLVAEK